MFATNGIDDLVFKAVHKYQRHPIIPAIIRILVTTRIFLFSVYVYLIYKMNSKV